MANPSIVPIALTYDDRTGYTLWAPPWEEDGEQWQAFFGADGKLFLFESPRALAAYCRTAGTHDLDDHPVWPVLKTLAPDDLTPDEDHRYDLDGLYELVAGEPDRWSVEGVAETVDIVTQIADVCDAPRIVRPLAKVPEFGLLQLGDSAFYGRDGAAAWTAIGAAVDEHWEDVLAALAKRFRWPTADETVLDEEEKARKKAVVAADREAKRNRGKRDKAAKSLGRPAEDRDRAELEGTRRGGAGTAAISLPSTAWDADAAEVAEASEFWESIGILPVEVRLPEGTGLTLRCYIDDVPRYLGSQKRIRLFRSIDGLTMFMQGRVNHDLREVSTWSEAAAAKVAPLPAEADRYDLVEVRDLFAASASTELFDYSQLSSAFECVLDMAEYGDLDRIAELTGPNTALGRALVESDRGGGRSLRPADTEALATDWKDLLRVLGRSVRWYA